MGFETPALLLTAGLVALPIIAHLLRRQDVPTMRLPTIALLAKAKADDRRRTQLIDRLLFLCRVLAILMIVLVASSPYWMRSVAGTSGPEALAIVVDDSMSMTAERGNQTLLDTALSDAKKLVARLDPVSELTVVLGGHPPRAVVVSSREHDAASARLAAASVASARADALCEAVELAATSLVDSDRIKRRLVIFSDFANDTATCGWPDDVVVQFMTRRLDEWRNVAIESFDVEPEAPSSGALVGNLRIVGKPLRPEGSVEIFQRGTRIAEAPIEWDEAGGNATVRFERPIDTDPAAQARLKLSDTIETDNSSGVLLRASNAIHVLILQAERSVWGRRQYVDSALAAASTSDVPFLVRRVSAPDLRRNALDWADVAILPDIPLRDADLASAIRSFVAQGGGLLVAPGDTVQPRRYAALFGDVLPARFTAKQTLRDKARIRSDAYNGLNSVRVFARMPLEPAATLSDTLIEFDDGSPAFLLARHGNGQVAVMAMSLDDAWTDLPFQPAFVPFIARAVAQLSGSPKRRLAPFEAISLPGSQPGRPTQVVSPSGRLETLESGARATYSTTDEVGAYRVMVDGADAPRFAFTVEPPTEESHPRFGPTPGYGGDDASAAGAKTKLNRERASLAPWLLLLLAFLVIAEGWLRHTPRPRTR